MQILSWFQGSSSSKGGQMVKDRHNNQKPLQGKIKRLGIFFLSQVLLSVPVATYAQLVIDIDGEKYESVSWPEAPQFVSSLTGEWSENGGGAVDLDPEFYAWATSETISFTDPVFTDFGISLTGVTSFRTNMGQHNEKENLPAEDQTIG